MNKIKKVSLLFKTLFQIFLISLPILFIISWIYAPEEVVLFSGFLKLQAIPDVYNGMHVYSSQGTTGKALLHTLSAHEKILGSLLSAIPMLIQMLVLYSLIKLFNLYEKGEIFSLKPVQYIRKIGYFLLVGQLIEPFYQFLLGIILTINNPPHYRYAAISLDQTNIGIILMALLVILISWIMAEGCRLHEEQQLTV